MKTTNCDWCGDHIDPKLETHSIELEHWVGGDPIENAPSYDVHEACADTAMTALRSVMVRAIAISLDSPVSAPIVAGAIKTRE